MLSLAAGTEAGADGRVARINVWPRPLEVQSIRIERQIQRATMHAVGSFLPSYLSHTTLLPQHETPDPQCDSFEPPSLFPSSP